MKIKNLYSTIQSFRKKEKSKQLYTEWGSKIEPEHVLGEYPRPQLVRDHYVMLNGYWKYAFGSRKLPVQYEGSILVPFSPESALSGVGRALSPDEYLWYERTLPMDSLPAGKRCILHFGAVDQRCHVWVNGERVITHHGGYLPFEADITDKLRKGENILRVCVQDVTDTSYHTRGKQKLHRGGMFYTAQSGIWQPVWYEWVPECHIGQVLFTSDVDRGTVTVQLTIEGRDGADGSGQVFVYRNKELVAGGKLGEGGRLTLPIPEPVLWTPETPELYDVNLLYGADRVESYFAMRCFTVEQDEEGISRFCLNHQPYFMNGVLDQGYWPDGLMTAPSDEAFIYDIGKMKELGFNTIRKHCKIEPLRWYYHCDRLGMLVWQDMVNGGSAYRMESICYFPTLFPKLASKMKDDLYFMTSRSHQKGREEWNRECVQTVELLRSVPSLAVWVVFNEGWGQFDAQRAVEQIQRLDPHRLIDQASGWFDQGGGDFASSHEYFRRLTVHPESRASILSEFGGYACYVKGHSYSSRIYGYKIYGDTGSFTRAFGQLYGAEIPRLQAEGLCGAIYTQLSDVEEEVNGLLTYDRKFCKII